MMKIELDKTEYENIKTESRNIGFKEGYEKAATFVYCKRLPNWRDKLHWVAQSSLPYCPTCELLKEITEETLKVEPPTNFLEVKLPEIRERISEIINKKFPTGHPQRYKATDLYDKIIKYLEKV